MSLVLRERFTGKGATPFGLLHDLSDSIYNWKVKVIGNKFENQELI